MFLKLIILLSTFLFSQDPCTCENNFEPVCGSDGFTYPNECMALCFGVQVDYSGACGTQSNCEPGEYADVNGDCMSCEPGTYSSDGISCDSCPAGTFADGQMDCSDMGMPDMYGCGASSCVECEPGYWSSQQSSECMVCEPGQFSEGGAIECEGCPYDNLFSNGQMNCDDIGMPDIFNCGGTDCVDCNGEPWGDAIVDEYGDCSESQSGCTYVQAQNFNPDAFLDDGSCIFPCEGDFNDDGNKDILDVVTLVNEILDGILCE